MRKYLLLKILIIAFGIIIFPHINLPAQQYIFATLGGSPVMNTTGWNLVGAAKVGHTIDPTDDEMILCPPVTWQSGGCFFNTPLNLGICNAWIAEFDYRIYDGSGADGIAFCFLANPPTGYINGYGVGIPAKPKGIMVVLDQWHNCGPPTPKLEIRYGDGINDYNECPGSAQPEVDGLAIIRQPTFNHMRIEYNNGNINVYINNFFELSGYYLTNYTGYLGFTSSTGTATDNHSVKNVIIYTNMPIAEAGSDKVICTGDSIRIGALPRKNYHYKWTPATGLDSPNIANPFLKLTNHTGQIINYKYKVTVDSAGLQCISTDSAVISVAPRPALKSINDTTVCATDSLLLNAQNGFTSYLWSTNDTTSYTEIKKSGVYWVRVKDNNGCIAKDTMVVTIKPTPQVNITSDSICKGKSDTLTASRMTVYTWSPAAGLNTTTGNKVIASPSITTTYTVTGILNGCSGSTKIAVYVNQPPKITVTPNDTTICKGGTATLIASGGISYIWSPATGLSTTSGVKVNATLDSSMTYCISGTDKHGCTDSVKINVLIAPKIILTISPNPAKYCPGGSVTLTANGANSYTWSPATGLSSTIGATVSANPLAETKYTVTGTDIYTCTDTASVTVSKDRSFKISVAPDTASICKGKSVILNATGGTQYTWTPAKGLNSINSPTAIASPQSTITYTIIGSNNMGCKDTVTAIVNVLPSPTASFSASPQSVTIINPEVTFDDLSGGNPESWLWMLGNGDISDKKSFEYKYSKPGKYLVTLKVTDKYGCTDSTFSYVMVENNYYLYLPNVFKPDDNINNIFYAYGVGIYDFNMIIFNRWGQKVFETKDISKGWDGKYNGNSAPAGTYVYSVIFKDSNNTEHTKIGQVTLLK